MERLELLKDEAHKAASRVSKHRPVIIATAEDLDEDSGCFLTSENELSEFGIAREHVASLTVAYQFYEDMIDIVSPGNFGGLLADLLDEYAETLEGHRERYFQEDHFVKLCQEVLEVPEASSVGYLRKREKNLGRLIIKSH